MKSISIILTSLLLTLLSASIHAQSIKGTWQLVKESSCLENEMAPEKDTLEEMVMKMKSMSAPAPQIIKFKDKGAGEESTRILYRKKKANSKNFLYKFNGETLLILDKKSQTLVDSYTVDKFSADSLILSNSSQPCETKIFIKIKEAR